MRNKVRDCRYNPGVGCSGQMECENCGWNPAATTERKKIIRSVELRDVMGVLRGQDRVVIIRQVGPHECEGVAEGTVRDSVPTNAWRDTGKEWSNALLRTWGPDRIMEDRSWRSRFEGSGRRTA